MFVTKKNSYFLTLCQGEVQDVEDYEEEDYESLEEDYDSLEGDYNLPEDDPDVKDIRWF